MRSQKAIVFLWGLLLATVVSAIQCQQARVLSPTYDEPATLASGIVAVETGNLDYYAVCAPVAKLWAGVAANSNVKLVSSPAEAVYKSGRPEFGLGQQLIETEQSQWLIFKARLARIPLFIGCGFVFLTQVRNTRAAMISCLLWFSSPLMLGHACLVTSDGFTAFGAVFVLFSTLGWLETNSRFKLLLAGGCWGFAISCKYSMFPFLMLLPISYLGYWLTSGLGMQEFRRLCVGYVVQVLVALFAIACIHRFDGIGQPFRVFDLQSEQLQWLSGSAIPSVLPRVMLQGIDLQFRSMQNPLGMYILGCFFSGGCSWGPLLAYPIKESLVCILCVVLGMCGLTRSLVNTNARVSPELAARCCFLASFTIAGFVVVCSGASIAWNTRYLMPVLPAVYLLLGYSVPAIAFPLPWRNGKRIEVVLPLLLAMAVLGMARTRSCYFSYLSPLVGGVYANPPALHESNFDSGQDLLRLEEWLLQHSESLKETPAFIIAHGTFLSEIEALPPPPSIDVMESALRRAEGKNESGSSGPAGIIIVARGFCHAMRWNVAFSNLRRSRERNRIVELAGELLRHEPALFISPTYAVYELDSGDPRAVTSASR